MKTLSTSVLTLALVSAGPCWAQSVTGGIRRDGSPRSMLETLLGGEARTIHLARTAYQERRFNESARLFEQAVTDVPRRRSELLREYANALTSAGRSREAAALFREMLARAPNAASRKDLSVQLGLALTNSRQHAAALGVYTKLLGQYPGNTDFALRRASLLSALGQTDAAVTALDKVPATAWVGGAAGAMGDSVLIAAAAAKAKSGQTAGARQLYDRAFRHNGQLRSVYQRDFAALTVAERPVQISIASPVDRTTAYRRELVRAAPGSQAFVRLQKQYAGALTDANMLQQAVGAWDGYLRYAQSDTEAQLARARLLERIGQTGRARDAFASAYARNPGNAATRAGLLGATLSLARRAARDSLNEESRELFATAMQIDGGRDRDIQREYADQLSFSGRPLEAIPLYLDALANPAISPLNRRRAMVGLADAYSWSDRLSDALPVYTQLAAAEPDDAGLQWSKLICEARLTARSDRNAESVILFSRAIAVAPERENEILPEYADQLSFVGRSAEAIQLYKLALAQPTLIDKQRLAIRMGLAQAYEWAGKHADAKKEYADLIKANPKDTSLQWRQLVVSARDAAINDRNAESVALFARAIQFAPERSTGILTEYADQLSFTGRSNWALTFYKAALDQPNLTEQQKTGIYMGQARAYDWTGNYVASKAIYDTLAKKNPTDVKLRWYSILASAREAGRTDQNAKAATLFADAIKLLPARRMDVLKEYADKLTFSDQPRLAIPLYRELLLQSNTAKKQKEYGVALALALAWDKQLAAALDVYQTMANADPSDLNARIGAGQMLSWMGRRPDARVEYQRVLQVDPLNGAATRGLAQVEDWDGRHLAAQVLLRARLQQAPNDQDARRMLAQSLVWSGRPDVAIGELEMAMNSKSELLLARPTYSPRDNRAAMVEGSRDFP